MLVHLPEMSLILAGKNTTAYAQKIQNTIEKLNLKDRVFIAGKISEIDKNYYYKNCTAFVFPSLREGFGIPPIEAMAYGTPVFLSNKSSLPEVGGEHAFYWEHFDAVYMAETVKNKLHRFTAEKDRFQEDIRAHAHSFSWLKAASKYMEVYKSLIK